MKIDSPELIKITGGGFEFTSAMLSAINKSVETIYNLGRSIGSSIRRIFTGSLCF